MSEQITNEQILERIEGLTVAEVAALIEDIRDSDGDIDPDCLPEEFSIVEDGEWEQDYKYQNQTIIVKYGETYWEIDRTRSGSPFTDWYYGESSFRQVEPHEETIVVTKWVGV